jgi:DNA polymerase-3 subunit alpha
VFSELLASERDKLEAGCSLLLHVNAQFEGDSIRCVAQRIEALDQAMQHLADGIDIFFDSAAPLAEIRAALADAGPGRGQIRLIPWLDDATEVEIALPSAWRITGALVGRLRAIPGVRDVREV